MVMNEHPRIIIAMKQISNNTFAKTEEGIYLVNIIFHMLFTHEYERNNGVDLKGVEVSR